MNTRKPFVVPALAGLIPFRLKAVQQTAQPQRCNFLFRPELIAAAPSGAETFGGWKPPLRNCELARCVPLENRFPQNLKKGRDPS